MLMFAFTTPLIQADVTVINRELDWDQVTDDQWDDPSFDAYTLPCVEVESVWTVTHTDRTIWMVLINPIVTVAEVSPLVDPETYQTDGRAAPGLFSEIHREVVSGRLGALEPASFDGCDAESVYP